MRVLITGGLGYVGGRLANYLKERHTSLDISLSTTRKQYPHWSESFNIVRLNLEDRPSVVEALNQVKPNVVIHLAALQQTECLNNPSLAFKINEQGTRHLIEACLKEGTKRILYFSTFQVYGQPTGEVNEKTKPDPKNVYSQTKFKGEEILKQYQSQQLNWAIFRLSNAFGAPQDTEVAESVWGLVFNAFCRSAIEKGKITIRSNQYRDFITMEDLVRAIEHFLFSIKTWPNEAFNVGGECCLSVREVAEKVSAVYQDVYGKEEVTIEGPSQDRDKIFEPFSYKIDKLKKTGFTLSKVIDQEIRDTLSICETFEKKRV